MMEKMNVVMGDKTPCDVCKRPIGDIAAAAGSNKCPDCMQEELTKQAIDGLRVPASALRDKPGSLQSAAASKAMADRHRI